MNAVGIDVSKGKSIHMGLCTTRVVGAINQSKLPDINGQANHNIMHSNGFGEANGFSA